MSDHPTPSPLSADPLAAPGVAPPAALEPAATTLERRTRSAIRAQWVALAILALIVLVGGILLWNDDSSREGKLTALQSQVDDDHARVAKLEALPPPPPPVNLAPLQQAVAELQTKLTALANKPPPQATLDDASRQQLAALSGRVDSATARENQLGTAEQADVAKLTDALNGLSDKLNGGLGAADAKTAALATQVEASTKASSAVTALSAQEARVAQLQSAAAALAAGRPLGSIPNAPPALARFATQAPPTEASLRLSFQSAADAAREAGEPSPQTMPFLQRMWQRAQSSVTVKAGNTLVVGDALSGTLDQARHLLDAGDLAGAVGALNGLSGPAAQAMAPWRDQAQSLLDARAALISAAGH